MLHKIVCALDTGDLDSAIATVKRLSPRVRSYKVGHALTLPHGLGVLDWLRAAGAERIFLDLKFHDIPNSVALAVREAAQRGVWMTTVHLTGGFAMLEAAMNAACAFDDESRPLIIGVGVLTSIDETILRDEIGVARSVEDQMTRLAQLGERADLDGFVCSPQEIKALRASVGRERALVVPGIRLAGGDTHDQKRTGDPATALADGASYLVIGRALADAPDPDAVLERLAAL